MDKYQTIAALETQLQTLEESICWASRGGEHDEAHELFLQRGEVIKELQKVR